MWPIPAHIEDLGIRAGRELDLAELAIEQGVDASAHLGNARVMVAQHTGISHHYASELAKLLPGLGYHGN